MSNDSNVQIKIPEQLVSDMVRAEILRTIPPEDKQRLFDSVVKTALGPQKDNYGRYEKETYLVRMTREMIQDEAKKVFGEWLEENRAALRDALLKHLRENKSKQLRDIAENIAGSITKFRTYINLELDD